MTLIGGGLLLKRRLTNPRVRATSSAGDILIITLLVIRNSGTGHHSVLRTAH